MSFSIGCRGISAPMHSTPPLASFFTDLGVSEALLLSYFSSLLPFLSQQLCCVFKPFLNMLSQKHHQHHWLTQLRHQLELAPSDTGGTSGLSLHQASPSVTTFPQTSYGNPAQCNSCHLWCGNHFKGTGNNTLKRKPATNSVTLASKKLLLRRLLASATGEQLKTSCAELRVPSWGWLMKVQTTAKCFLWKTCLRTKLWSARKYLGKKIHHQLYLAFLKVFGLDSKIPGKLQLLQILLLEFKKGMYFIFQLHAQPHTLHFSTHNHEQLLLKTEVFINLVGSVIKCMNRKCLLKNIKATMSLIQIQERPPTFLPTYPWLHLLQHGTCIFIIIQFTS